LSFFFVPFVAAFAAAATPLPASDIFYPASASFFLFSAVLKSVTLSFAAASAASSAAYITPR
jgi:hypothetical protein